MSSITTVDQLKAVMAAARGDVVDEAQQKYIDSFDADDFYTDVELRKLLFLAEGICESFGKADTPDEVLEMVLAVKSKRYG